MAFAILFDSTKCIGCRQCESACAQRWKLPYDDTIASEEKLSAHKLTAVQTKGDRFARRMCMHCQQPGCASACPVGALQKTSDGPVVYDASKCIGCRYCMIACPFQVPAYEWNARLPKLRKCDQCADRQKAGKPTTCSEACPAGATISGTREAMIAEARKRLQENPNDYYPGIYGMNQVGGTSVLYLSAVPFDQLGLPSTVGQDPLPDLTWRALSLVPGVVSVGTVLLGGVWWITHRREEVAAAEKKEGRS